MTWFFFQVDRQCIYTVPIHPSYMRRQLTLCAWWLKQDLFVCEVWKFEKKPAPKTSGYQSF